MSWSYEIHVDKFRDVTMSFRMFWEIFVIYESTIWAINRLRELNAQVKVEG